MVCWPGQTCKERPVFGFQHSDGRPWVLDELRKVSAITNKDCYFHRGSGAETRSKFLDSLTNVHRKMRLTRIWMISSSYCHPQGFHWPSSIHPQHESSLPHINTHVKNLQSFWYSIILMPYCKWTTKLSQFEAWGCVQCSWLMIIISFEIGKEMNAIVDMWKSAFCLTAAELLHRLDTMSTQSNRKHRHKAEIHSILPIHVHFYIAVRHSLKWWTVLNVLNSGSQVIYLSAHG